MSNFAPAAGEASTTFTVSESPLFERRVGDGRERLPRGGRGHALLCRSDRARPAGGHLLELQAHRPAGGSSQPGRPACRRCPRWWSSPASMPCSRTPAIPAVDAAARSGVAAAVARHERERAAACGPARERARSAALERPVADQVRGRGDAGDRCKHRRCNGCAHERGLPYGPCQDETQSSADATGQPGRGRQPIVKPGRFH